MLKNNNHKMLIVLSTVFITALMLATAFSAGTQSFEKYTGTYRSSAGTSAPPYNITLMETGLPNNTYWHVRGYSGGGTNGYTYSNTQYINFTNLENGSYYFTVATLSTSTNTYTPNPGSITMMLDGSNVEQTIHFANTTLPKTPQQYHVNLTITNMPGSIPGSPQWYWEVTIMGVNLPYNQTFSSNFPFMTVYGLSNGTYSYRALTSGTSTSGSIIYGTKLSPPSGQFTVNGKNLSLNYKLSFVKQYNLKFIESGLPATQSFTVSVYSPSLGIYLTNQTYVSQSNNNGFTVLNGTYYYTVYPGSNIYTASPSEGTLTVSGSNINVDVAFTYSTSTYSALFKISNPPVDLKGSLWSWYLFANGHYHTSYNSTLLISNLKNGTYQYELTGNGIAFSSTYGYFTIKGKSVEINLHLESSYTVMFKVQNISKFVGGPPPMTSVITNVETGSSLTLSSDNGTLIIPNTLNGTYDYSISVPPPYTLKNTSGTFTVNGSKVTISLFATEGSMYLIRFVESGIPLWGSTWGVVFDDGFTYNNSYTSPYLSATNSPLPYLSEVPNGTYTIQGFIYANGHYHFTPPQKVTVGGSSQNFTVDFSAVSAPGTSGSGFGGLYFLIGVALAVIIVAGATAYIVYRRGRKGD